MDSNLVKRILFAVVAIPLALGFVWWGGWPLAALVAVISGLGYCELNDLAVKQGVRPFKWIGCTLAVLVPLALQSIIAPPAQAQVVTPLDTGLLFLGPVMFATLTIIALAVFRRTASQKPLAAAAVTLFGIVYTAVLPSFLLIFRRDQPLQSWEGVSLVFFPLVITWVCDTAAMFGGRAFGRVKLAPTISPNKTREGAIAGVVGGVAVAILFALFVFPRFDYNGCGEGDFGLGPAILMGVVLSIVGQIGDLAESLFKREAGVKDSSSLIPGHGGVLDRFDSLYVVIPVAALLYLVLVMGHTC